MKDAMMVWDLNTHEGVRHTQDRVNWSDVGILEMVCCNVLNYGINSGRRKPWICCVKPGYGQGALVSGHYT